MIPYPNYMKVSPWTCSWTISLIYLSIKGKEEIFKSKDNIFSYHILSSINRVSITIREIREIILQIKYVLYSLNYTLYSKKYLTELIIDYTKNYTYFWMM